MLVVITSLLPIFAIIILGFALRKSGFIPLEQWRGVELIAYWLLFPALLITTLARSTLSFGELAPFAMTLLALVIIITIIVWLARIPLEKLLNVKGPAFTTVFQTSTRWHGFIALAIVDKLYGETGLSVIAIAFAAMAPYLNVVNILVLITYAGKKKFTSGAILLNLARNPLILGVLIGIAIKLSGFVMPDPVFTTLDLLGSGALGVSLLAMGAGLRWRAMLSSGKEVFVASALKLLLNPAIAGVLAMLFGVSGMQFVIVIIAAAVPTAVNGYVLARTMGGDAELYAATSTAQVLASFVTLPLIIAAAVQFAG
ncbi:hypothetical protein MNBD_ALPHA12-2217 [hydrothermal vent metagenome]|uniref:Auxin efflux carrier family protein n=1 Tax=hydrothermal vent metagenome TaxID=652676 RepID=A0A3B0U2S8_9ZZZZ